jgi:(1->4)-alpha-D-glucan 1-alpha-D-glucosylmutase
MTAPRATLRLQFHKGFTFADAEEHVPYFARLGISHVYASPITTARAGSLHGYDVIDPTRVNPELGGEDGLRRLVAALRMAGLGLIVDIVPNHMAVGAENAWWLDVLKLGRGSRYAPYFDIDWETEDDALRGKVLLPVLGRPLEDALAAGELELVTEPQGRMVRYFDHRFPIADKDANGPGDLPLAALLARQHYRLAWWRVANDEINWRRFFDINELAGLRMEHPPAFEDVHALVFRLYADGLIDGVRVDHVDGLADPAGYCRTLRRRLDALGDRRAYIVVEKILLRDETLPVSWECDGTSGYDFMNDVSALLHDARGETPLAVLWEQVSGRSADFAVEEEASRREIVARSFTAQLEACAGSFHRLARAHARELSRASLCRALTELLVHFPVYRTYTTARERPATDARFLSSAVAAARRTCFPMDRASVDAIEQWLTKPGSDPVHARAVTQFQQLSAPIAAKAVEDTAFYRYGRLLSRNDVGFDVRRFSDSAADFHAKARRRGEQFPRAMLATATHDHKRGEDVRARLAVLSEHAADWATLVPPWIVQCVAMSPARDDATRLHAGDIAMLLQMIVGAWPLDLDRHDDNGRTAFAERLARWQEKALREEKLASDWTLPNAAYETAARELIMSLVGRGASPELLDEIVSFVGRIAPAGAVNGLAQTLLKLTAPGTPDIYRGTELWDFSLVDPDNRRPVDLTARAASMDAPPSADLTKHWRDGRIKQALIARALAVRRARPRLFEVGSYEPLDVRGACADRVVAFLRRVDDDVAITVVPRTVSALLRDGDVAFTPDAWKDTAVALPHANTLVNAIDRERCANDTAAAVGSLFRRLPVALLISFDLDLHPSS